MHMDTKFQPLIPSSFGGVVQHTHTQTNTNRHRGPSAINNLDFNNIYRALNVAFSD